MANWITRNQTACILGVKSSTVAQYCFKGLLTYRFVNKTYYCDEDEVLEFRSTHFRVIHRIEGATEQYIKEIKAKEHEAERRLSDINRFIASLNFLHKRFMNHNFVQHLYLMAFARYGDNIPEKRIDMCQYLINQNHTIKDACSYFGISRPYLYEIFSRTIAQLNRNMRKTLSLPEENAELIRRNQKQHEHITTLIDTNNQLREDLAKFNVYPDKEAYSQVRLNCQKLKLDTTSLSARTLNCLRDIAVYNLEQLLCIRENELKCLRNYGKKTHNELTEFISRLSQTDDYKDICFGLYGLNDKNYFKRCKRQ